MHTRHLLKPSRFFHQNTLMVPFENLQAPLLKRHVMKIEECEADNGWRPFYNAPDRRNTK